MARETDIAFLHGSRQTVGDGFLKITDIQGKGRGFVATQFIPRGTVVHHSLPLATAVSQEWIPETCAWCFEFNYPKRMRVSTSEKNGQQYKGILFCSEQCKNECITNGSDNEWSLSFRGFRALDAAYTVRKTRSQEVVEPNQLFEDMVRPKIDASDDQFKEWLDNTWTTVTQNPEFIACPWMPQDADRTMCRLITSCLAKRQCEQHDLMPKPDIPKFSDIWQIQNNELTVIREACRVSSGSIPDVMLDAMHLYVFLSTALESIMECPHVLFRAILFREKSNSFGLWELPRQITLDDGVTDDLELLGWGIYPSAVYFNHSCEANVAKVRQGRNLNFIARRDIQPGEEACISYGSVHEGVQERRQRLLEHYGFFCACTRCLLESDKA